MHEMAIVEALIDQVRGEVEQQAAPGRVTRLNLIVGRLSGVCSDSLRFAFELMAPGTIVERARLHIDEPKAACRCETCGQESEIDDLGAGCPRCASREIGIVGGQELLLESIELADEEEDPSDAEEPRKNCEEMHP
jgi:hydrogenase nickel incorporation protein HypA/HybF